jgi:hypothetical protein
MARSAEIEGFVSRYSEEIAAQLRRARAELRRLIPKGYELVYESHNALIFAFGPTPKASQLVISIAGYPKWVTLFFAKGTALEDPKGLLEGSGPGMRSVRLVPFEALMSRPVQALIKRALAAEAAAFKQAPPLTTVVKAISAKQRPRRPE